MAAVSGKLLPRKLLPRLIATYPRHIANVTAAGSLWRRLCSSYCCSNTVADGRIWRIPSSTVNRIFSPTVGLNCRIQISKLTTSPSKKQCQKQLRPVTCWRRRSTVTVTWQRYHVVCCHLVVTQQWWHSLCPCDHSESTHFPRSASGP